MKLTATQLRRIIREEVSGVLRETSEEHDYEGFLKYAKSKGVNPKDDTVKSLVGDWAHKKGVDAKEFYSGLQDHMGLTKGHMSEIAVAAFGDKDPQRFLHGFESGHPMDDEGYMIKSRMADVKEMAEMICGLLDEGDQLPAWVQDLVASAHTDLEHVKDYLVGDEKLRSYSKTIK